ncbi:hypothetical protein SAMN02799625_05928 [Methylobacterium sp. UNC300MFChir4.1]|uniref:hypothetical protein n=1 Tax=Methylobacterium sp. UNC300MFChir4.1 TaxID=1502747 RepID=UPI0008D4E0A3|nr:hypothetical protein [Methylobacterium sp. UNC300MFChir4.1]SEP39704.1 hypothetical protein SAMN02799625_05928 [Methylobacterium sp. UNC300MFChir4.1]
MPEIRVLSVRTRRPDQSDRLHAELAAAYARGTDLGPRAPHIQAGGDTLLELTRAFQRAIGDLDLTLIEPGLQDPDMHEALRGFVVKAEGLANTAQSFASSAQGLANTAHRFPAAL